jgi:hypothetical protein
MNAKENPPPAPPFAKEGGKTTYLLDLTECCPASPFEKGGLRGIFFWVFQFYDSLDKGRLGGISSACATIRDFRLVQEEAYT